jgi:hypothetical protein
MKTPETPGWKSWLNGNLEQAPMTNVGTVPASVVAGCSWPSPGWWWAGSWVPGGCTGGRPSSAAAPPAAARVAPVGSAAESGSAGSP